ncbi:MAG TPA: hypothetical protein VNI20_04945 [Fimbriimonadaceae bacterium]|nr:hypothetical protein [Fimbriimonadaceae bacterium]
MNLNRARDFYSAYYEGSLDQGLRQAFEHALSNESEVSAEYGQFVRIMDELRRLDRPVEVPSDLHLKIRERVDAHINSKSRKTSPSWLFAWKPFTYGVVATAAIIGVVASFSSNRGSIGTAGLIDVPTSDPVIEFNDGTTVLKFQSAAPNTVSVTRVEDGSIIATVQAGGKRIASPLTNSSEGAELVRIGFSSNFRPLYLAVPGTKAKAQPEGKGTLADMMVAMADQYRVPIVCESTDVLQPTEWNFDQADAVQASSDELGSLGMKAAAHNGGLVWISSK